MTSETSPFLGPTDNYIKKSKKRIKESDKIFKKRIKKIMKKLNRL